MAEVNSEMHTMQAAHPPRINKGTNILGRMLPCICMNRGHFECFKTSRGPVCASRGG